MFRKVPNNSPRDSSSKEHSGIACNIKMTQHNCNNKHEIGYQNFLTLQKEWSEFVS